MNLQPHCSASRGVTSAVSREKSTCSRKMRELADIEARRSYTICSPGPYVCPPRATSTARLFRAAPARLWAPQYVVTPQLFTRVAKAMPMSTRLPAIQTVGRPLGMSSENGSFTTSPRVCLRSEEHTSELQSPCNLVCRLLLEKKKKKNAMDIASFVNATGLTLAQDRRAFPSCVFDNIPRVLRPHAERGQFDLAPQVEVGSMCAR